MWFEARKQEKNIRSMMVDSRRRAERRQAFYDKTKKDPTEFLQVHGSKSRIYQDPNIYKAAEGQGAVRPWQGDPKILIDRFDARAYLDQIPECLKSEDSDASDEEERRSSYERYRILIKNDFEKVGESKFLKQIYMEERFGASASTSAQNSLAKSERQQKKSLASKKAMIGFDYGDNKNNKGNKSIEEKRKEDSDENESDDGDISEPELDAPMDVNVLTPEQCRDLNKIGSRFSMNIGDFTGYMYEDKDRQDQLDDLKRVEEAKSKLSGKNSRKERQILKQKRLILMGKGMDYVRSSKLAEMTAALAKSPESESSSSRTPSPNGEGKMEYITTFGQEPDSEPEKQPEQIHGPKLPTNEQRKLLALRRNKSRTPEKCGERSKSRGHSRRRSRSRSRSNRGQRSQRGRRSRSPEGHTSYRTTKSRSRSRDRKRLRNHRRRHSSNSSRSSSNSKERTRKASFIQSNAMSVSNTNTKREISNANEMIDKEEEMMSLNSDLSEEERESREVTNAKRRVRNAHRRVNSGAIKSGSSNGKNNVSSSKGSSLSLRERLAISTQKALKRTYIKDKEDMREKRIEINRGERERSLELRELSSLQRKREREKRHQEDESRSESRSRSRSKSNEKDNKLWRSQDSHKSSKRNERL